MCLETGRGRRLLVFLNRVECYLFFQDEPAAKKPRLVGGHYAGLPPPPRQKKKLNRRPTDPARARKPDLTLQDRMRLVMSASKRDFLVVVVRDGGFFFLCWFCSGGQPLNFSPPPCPS